jgi:hypothetical protein
VSVHGFVYVFGSSTVNVCSIEPKFTRLYVCVIFA